MSASEAQENGSVHPSTTSTTTAATDGEVMTTPAAGSSKPRARLGPLEVVQLPPDSESEDEQEEDGEGGEERAIEDFLKDYPDDTEVSIVPAPPRTFLEILPSWCFQEGRLTGVLGSTSPTFTTEECLFAPTPFRPVWFHFKTTVFEAE